jgi:hypothetical protein
MFERASETKEELEGQCGTTITCWRLMEVQVIASPPLQRHRTWHKDRHYPSRFGEKAVPFVQSPLFVSGYAHRPSRPNAADTTRYTRSQQMQHFPSLTGSKAYMRLVIPT